MRAQFAGQTLLFDIPSLPLDEALQRFSKETNIHFLYRTELNKGSKSTPVKGYMSIRGALQQMLAGTDIEFSFTSNDTLVLTTEGAEKRHTDQLVTPNGRDRTSRAKKEGSRLTAVAAATDMRPEEIEVIGRKHGKRLQEYTGSASVFDMGALSRARVDGLEDIVRRISNASFEERPGGVMNIAVRGSGTSTFGSATNTDTALGLYYDDIYSYVQGSRIPLLFFDMEQIEVLKGPQGGLYGRNAVGGAIIAHTRKPHDGYEFYAGGELGDYASRKGEVRFNAPLGENLFFRASGYYDGRNSYYKNIDPLRSEVGDQTLAARTRLRWLPSSSVDVVLGYEYSHEDKGPTILVPTRFDENLTSVSDTDGKTLRDIHRLVAHIDYESSDSLQFRSITGYTTIDSDISFDLNNLNFNSSLQEFFTSEQRTQLDAYQFSQELMAMSPQGENSNWIVGLSYFRDYQTASSQFHTGFPSEGTTRSARAREGGISMFAAFADVSWPVWDHFSLGASLRYSSETRTAESDDFVIIDSRTGNPFPQGAFDFRVKYSRLSPGLSFTYQPSADLMAYIKYASGYQSGGTNNRASSSEKAVFGPSIAQNLEAGFRSSWLENRLFFNLTLFRAYQDNYQMRIEDGDFDAFANVGTARTDGAEIEFIAHLTPWLTLPVTWGYLDARFTDAQGSNVGDLTGLRLPGVPKHTLTIGADLHIDIKDDFKTYARFDYALTTGGTALDITAPDQPSVHLPLDNHSTLDVKAGVIVSDKYELYLYAENLLDDLHRIAGQIVPPVYEPIAILYSPPRTVGLGFSFMF